MAVSKTQNERPAIVALIDAVNTAEPIVAQNVQNIATLTQGLANEVSDRETTDTQLEQAIQDEAEARAQAVQAEAEARAQAVQAEAEARAQAVQAEATARAQAVQGVQNQIGEGIFSSAFTITQGFQQAGLTLLDINQWQDRFRLGLSTDVTVAAGSSTAGTLAFESPFGKDAEVAVFPVCVDASGNFTDLSCKLISADYSGFSFAVYNGTQTSVTTKVGFLAVKVN